MDKRIISARGRAESRKKANERFQLAKWRYEMLTKGYGSYSAIDKAVERGELIPMREYPKKCH